MEVASIVWQRDEFRSSINSLTSQRDCATADFQQVHMEESEEGRSWQKRMSWAECAEPHKTVLDTLASHWIEGELSHGELALEILRIRTVIADSLREAESEKKRPPRELANVSRELDILAAAVSEANQDPTSDVSHRRHSWFTTCFEQARDGHDDRGR